MDLKKQFGTDKGLEENGVWHDLGDGASVLVARLGNRNYTAEIKRLSMPHKRQIQLGKLSDDIWTAINIEAMASTILLDWKGIEDGGKPLNYSVENAIAMLTQYDDFRDVIAALANEMANFQAEAKAAEIKN